VLENLTIAGTETFQACQTLTAGAGVTVSATGAATFQAGPTGRFATWVPGPGRGTVAGAGRGDSIYSLRLTRTGPGFFSVTVAGSGETYCGPICEELELEVPHGSTVRVDALPNTGAVLWSWGTLPCSSSEVRCEFEVASEFISSRVTFAEATVTTQTFAVPAAVESSFVDSNSGARITIPAGATHSPSSVRLEVRTNERGEQVFSVEVLDPEAWTDGWHAIEIEMDLSAPQMQSKTRFALQDSSLREIGRAAMVGL
jgi:hypothetical protein